MAVIPATQEAEAGELNPGERGFTEPRLYHCTPASVTRAKLSQKTKQTNKQTKKAHDNFNQNKKKGGGLDTMVHACNPNTLGG